MARAKKVKVTKQNEATTIFDLCAIPNKEEKVLDMCSFVMNGKVVNVKANSVHKMDIANLDLLTSKPIKDVFVDLYSKYNPGKGMWKIKNQYGIAIGLCDQVTSYKAMLAHHRNNGANTLIVNGNKHFTIDMAFDVAKTFNLSLLKGKGSWAMLTVTESNVRAVGDFAIKLMGLKKK